MRFASSNNVGIGTTSPSYKLDVESSSDSVAGVYIQAGKSSQGEIQNTGLIVGSRTDMSTNDYLGISFTGNAATPARGRAAIGVKSTNGTSAMDLVFMTRSAADGSQLGSADEKMRIKSNGRVGINTTNPLELLNVHQTTATAGLYMPISIAGSRYQADYAVGIAFRPENNSSAYAAKTAIVGSGGGYGYNQADLHFCLNQSATITDEVNLSDTRMIIKKSGNVGIGLTNPDAKLEVTTSASQYTGRFDYTGSSGGAYGCLKLRISANTSPSFIDLFYDGFSTNPLSPVGAIVTTGSAVLYSSFSDYRLKENVADLTGALDRVNSLQPKTFNYINRPETTNEGFLAHELQEIVPQAVSGTKDGVDEDGNPKYQGVDNAHLVPLLVGAIKELKAEIETLKTQINN